ncbi:MAG: tRNA 2-selenouridine(34) synthase MnmH [Bacillota bacterium]
MKQEMLSIEECMKLKDVVFIDVRSPIEFKEATIPGAVNIPLLDDDERARVGTIFKQVCPEEAKKVGYEFVKPKLPSIFQEIQGLASRNKNVVLFCWRGGMRSQSLARYCLEQGLDIPCLMGGYKAYRRLVNAFFNNPENIPEMVVLMGLTGVGKTMLLHLLAERGLPAIDLEGLANNRGSVFGQVHGGVQPSQKNFEAMLYESIKANNSNYAIVECESRRIGKVFLPEEMFNKMNNGIKIHLYASLDVRVQRVVEDYAHFPEERLIDAIQHLIKTLGRQKVESLISLVRQRKYKRVAAELLTNYYDSLYGYPKDRSKEYDLSVQCDDLQRAAAKVHGFLADKFDVEV